MVDGGLLTAVLITATRTTRIPVYSPKLKPTSLDVKGSYLEQHHASG